MQQYWKYLHTRTAYRNRIVGLREDTYHFLPNDITRDFTVLEFEDWVNIIPLTPAGEVVMIRQWRHGVREETLEIPGGLIGPEDASPLQAASREMQEETGYTSDDIVHLGTLFPNPAIQNNRCHTFLARSAVCSGAQNLDPTEAIRVELVPLERVLAMLAQGEITHGLVVAAFAYLLLQVITAGESGEIFSGKG